MVELDRRLRDVGVRAYSVHLGVVATSLARHMSREDFAALTQYGPDSNATPVPNATPVDLRCDFVLPDRGAVTQVWAAVSPRLADIGSVYLEDCRISDDVRPYALDQDRPARLWALSEELCGVR